CQSLIYFMHFDFINPCFIKFNSVHFPFAKDCFCFFFDKDVRISHTCFVLTNNIVTSTADSQVQHELVNTLAESILQL
ncbi:hypothetical protein ACJX0J_014164, partial [Zea mays]